MVQPALRSAKRRHGPTLCLTPIRRHPNVTPAQEQALREAVAQAQQAAQQQAAAEPPSGIDPLQLEQAMTAQTNIDALYDMAIHIDNVADEAARARLGQVLEAKTRELES